MKCFPTLLSVIAATTAVYSAEPASASKTTVLRPQAHYGEIARRLSSMLPRYHVMQAKFDDAISQRAWTNLVTFYDFDHSVFLQSDLDRLGAHRLTIDDELSNGNVDFAYDIYTLYCERLRERIDFATNLLVDAKWDFSTNETYRIRRKDAPWPQTREEAEDHWRRRIKNELLVSILNRELDAEERSNTVAQVEVADSGEKTESKPVDSPEEILVKKYRQYVTVLTEPDEEAVLQHYLSAVARAYDPHSDYMSPTSKEDFDMDMNLTLCGVGAVLSMEDGMLKIVEVMTGGPVDVDGRIKAGDKIVGVQQADGEMEDVTWQPMKKSIRKIRGPKGTRVTLEIVPRSDPSGLTRKRIELVRDEIKLEDQAATGRVETVSLGGFTNRFGYVYLPGFYGTMDKRPNDPGYRSSAEDVKSYVCEFNECGAEGMVLDLRGDGGGSLREAVMLSSVFVASGPVVQICDRRYAEPLTIPSGNPVAFRRPLVVLIDRASASASEIVAGHLRDTGRAIVLGDVRTHGKGTVQTVMGMGPDKFGSMKITTARFYRVDGRSTQLKGIEADIHLPSLLDALDIGEDKMDNALPFTCIRKAHYSKCWDLDSYIPQLTELSAQRLAGDERYQRHLANVAGMREISDRIQVPLEREARKALMKSDRNLHELDDQINADEDEDKDDNDSKVSRRKRGNRGTDDDMVLREAFNILSDLVRLNGGKEMPTTKMDWYNAILGF